MKKNKLKKYLMESTDLCFKKLYEMLNPTSNYYNDIIHLRMRYQRIIDDQYRGVVSNDNRNLELNKIQIALIEFVDKLEDSDFENTVESNTQKSNLDEKSFNHFWKPFFETKTTIVIGTYDEDRFRAWEASTLMGTGDALALGIIMGVLNNVGIKDIDVVPTYNFSGDRYQNNLILLGGPDANIVSREFYNKIDTNFKFGDPNINEITLYDTKENLSYRPKYNTNKKVIRDYGFAFKTENPFNSETNIILLAGCYGFGTCSAAQLFESSRLLDKLKKSKNGEFEALVYSDVINDWVQKPKVIKSYEL